MDPVKSLSAHEIPRRTRRLLDLAAARANSSSRDPRPRRADRMLDMGSCGQPEDHRAAAGQSATYFSATSYDIRRLSAAPARPATSRSRRAPTSRDPPARVRSIVTEERCSRTSSGRTTSPGAFSPDQAARASLTRPLEASTQARSFRRRSPSGRGTEGSRPARSGSRGQRRGDRASTSRPAVFVTSSSLYPHDYIHRTADWPPGATG